MGCGAEEAAGWWLCPSSASLISISNTLFAALGFVTITILREVMKNGKVIGMSGLLPAFYGVMLQVFLNAWTELTICGKAACSRCASEPFRPCSSWPCLNSAGRPDQRAAGSVNVRAAAAQVMSHGPSAGPSGRGALQLCRLPRQSKRAGSFAPRSRFPLVTGILIYQSHVSSIFVLVAAGSRRIRTKAWMADPLPHQTLSNHGAALPLLTGSCSVVCPEFSSSRAWWCSMNEPWPSCTGSLQDRCATPWPSLSSTMRKSMAIAFIATAGSLEGHPGWRMGQVEDRRVARRLFWAVTLSVLLMGVHRKSCLHAEVVNLQDHLCADRSLLVFFVLGLQPGFASS